MTIPIVDSVAILKECEDIFPDYKWNTYSLTDKVKWMSHPIDTSDSSITVTYYFNNSELKLDYKNNCKRLLIPYLYNICSIKEYLIAFKESLEFKDFSLALEEIIQVLKKYEMTLKAYLTCDEKGDGYSSINLTKNNKSCRVYYDKRGEGNSIFSNQLNPKYKYFVK